MKNKKVLIVGNLYALAKKLSQTVEKVFVATGNEHIAEFAEILDIREDNPYELLNFVVKNDIDLTIVTSQKAMLSDITSIFQENNKAIFAPNLEAANTLLSKTLNKKLLYKLHIPTPRFASFDKLPLALNYIQTANYPLIISSDKINSAGTCHTTVKYATNAIETIFSQDEDKVIIEEYPYGHEFSMYVLTDGFQTLPLGVMSRFSFSQNGNSGTLTQGMGTHLPDNKISFDIQQKLMNEVFLETVTYFQNINNPYTGIIGVDAVLYPDDSYEVINLKPFFNDIDSQAIINSLEDDLYDLFESCANGCFADEYEDIITNNNVSVSCLIQSSFENKKIIKSDLINSDITFLNIKKNDDKEYLTQKGDNFILTAQAKTLSFVKEQIKEDINLLKFDGMKYRSDIL